MIRYQTLFRVDILHDYFLNRGTGVFEAQSSGDRSALSAHYSVSRFLEIFPDDRTRGALAGHKMLFRTTGFGFLVATQTDNSAGGVRPAIPPAADLRLSFAMRVKDARFANYTELGPEATGFYRFGSDANNEVAGVQFLSRPGSAFDPSRRYVAGETYVRAAGPSFDLFRALRDTGPSTAPVAADWERIPPDSWDAATVYVRGAVVLSDNGIYRALVNGPGGVLTNAAEWELLGVVANQYATAADAVVPVSGLFSLDLSGAALPEATIRLYRFGAATPLVERNYWAAAGVLDEVQLDLRGLSPGLYRLEVLDAALAVLADRGVLLYVAPAAAREAWFGVIDIGLGGGSYALLNPDGSLRSPVYTLRFLNRATRWRYIFPAAQPVGVGTEVDPEGGDGRILVTAAPRPLTRFGGGVRLQADSAATSTVSEEVLLPVPEINRIRRQNAQWFSEIHLSNLPLGL